MTSQPENSRVGTMFGPYEIRSLIGAGGMGEVYRAYDTVKDRTVAVKLLRPVFAADRGFQDRFRRESRLAAQLQEPHVIPVHDWGEIDGVLYIDMRLVEGRSVSAVLSDEGAMEPVRAASIVTQVAGALDAAHAAGLVHRDVKPDNVLLTPDDFAYLVDFGIAHLGGDTGLTSAGSAIGSFAYMAPERFTGSPVGPQTDVYSLACFFYECLTGQTPFPPGDVTQTMAAHLMSPPPRPSVTRPGLNPAFDDVIAMGMEKRPELRFASAGEFGRAAHTAAFSSAPTELAPRPIGQEHGRRQFSQHWPNLEGADYTPYRDHVETEVPERRTGFGRGQIVVVAGAAALLAAAVVGALWLILGYDRGQNQGSPTNDGTAPITSSTVAEQTPTESTTTTSQARIIRGLPGTDDGGFIGYPAARCTAGSEPAAEVRTTQSLIVVCQTGPGSFYYRGLRLSDGAGIELANAVRSSVGFDVTNPTDGTRYQIRPNVVNIASPDGQVSSEPVLQYTSS
jgi:serine/threonine protein kinase